MKKLKYWIPALVLLAATLPAPGQLFFKRKPAGPPQVAELLSTLGSSPDDRKRAAAAEGLRDFDAGQHAEIIPGLLAALKDSNSSVRAEAVQTLARMRPVSQQVGQALENVASHDENWRVRWQAKTSLLSYNWNGYRQVKNEPQKDEPKKTNQEPPQANPAPFPLVNNPLPIPQNPVAQNPVAPPVARPVTSEPKTFEPPVAQVPVTPLQPPVVPPQIAAPEFARPLPPIQIAPVAPPISVQTEPLQNGPQLANPVEIIVIPAPGQDVRTPVSSTGREMSRTTEPAVQEPSLAAPLPPVRIESGPIAIPAPIKTPAPTTFEPPVQAPVPPLSIRPAAPSALEPPVQSPAPFIGAPQTPSNSVPPIPQQIAPLDPLPTIPPLPPLQPIDPAERPAKPL